MNKKNINQLTHKLPVSYIDRIKNHIDSNNNNMNISKTFIEPRFNSTAKQEDFENVSELSELINEINILNNDIETLTEKIEVLSFENKGIFSIFT